MLRTSQRFVRLRPGALARCLAGVATLAVGTGAVVAQAETGHWSFTAPVAPPTPVVSASDWCRDPLDGFVLRRLEADGLRPSPQAEPRALLRRVYLDLIGLPPTRAELHAFLAEPTEAHYREVVEDLLRRPQHGEHMARGWLDVVRFADTNGIHHDHYREVSAYRDFVIRAFASNMPYDRFVADQLAGDLREDADESARIASGFHRLHRIIDRGTMLPEESQFNNVIDRVTAFGTTFLGLTVQCASCHDHKYDPISQREFYGLFAFFNNLDGAPETGRRSGTDFRRGLQPPYLELPDAEQRAERDRLTDTLAAARADLGQLEATPEAERGPDYEDLLDAARHLERDSNEANKSLTLAIPAALVMKERSEVRPAHVMRRGDYRSPGERVERHTPAFLPPLEPTGAVPSRADLARWLTRRDHPLTARVFVNRIWQRFFGIGIVESAEDFGVQGALPSHPELLDHLAVSFMDSGWDMRALVRRIVLSATYRQTSVASDVRFRDDPDNRSLARGPRFRLDAEVIRDQILATSGLLDGGSFGKSVKTPQPAGLWKAVALPDSYPRVHRADGGAARYRRSVYTFWKRGLPPPQMTILDAPSREFCVARRERTNTPLQALLLLNEPEYLRAAAHLAAEELRVPRADDVRLDVLYESITARCLSLPMREEFLGLIEDLRRSYRADPEAARQLTGAAGADLDVVEHACWTMVVSTLFNLDITRTKD